MAELQAAEPWLRHEQPGRLRPILSRYVDGPLPWSASDLQTVMRLREARFQLVRPTAGRIERPFALLAHYLGDVDPQADHPHFHDTDPTTADGVDDKIRPSDVAAPARAARPPWCGVCDQHTRHVELDEHTAARCATCHPRAGLDGITIADPTTGLRISPF